MRVIAGTARSLPLKTVKSDATRPTTDRIKETLFNMLNPYLPGARFLDLFAGSGAIGIEALSRGASYAAFAENAREALACIDYNLSFTHLKDRAEIWPNDVFQAISRMELKLKEPFGIVFMDPPYDHLLEKEVLKRLRTSSLIDQKTIIIFEASLETEFDYLEEFGYSLMKQKTYKTNQHVWVRKQEI